MFRMVQVVWGLERLFPTSLALRISWIVFPPRLCYSFVHKHERPHHILSGCGVVQVSDDHNELALSYTSPHQQARGLLLLKIALLTTILRPTSVAVSLSVLLV